MTHWARQIWRDSTAFGRLAAIAAICGLTGLAPALPTAVRGPALLLFAFAGPGAAVLDWFPELDTRLRRALVPGVGTAVLIIVSYLALLEGLWHPRGQLLVLICATLVSVGLATTIRPRARTELPA